ncbi:MAG: hypothetical protein KDD47_20395 [Acidobacteria bacterium]|nr:hypothetical protein [Acidobacteriota bacterium]
MRPDLGVDELRDDAGGRSASEVGSYLSLRGWQGVLKVNSRRRVAKQLPPPYERGEVLAETRVELELWVEPEDCAMMTHLLRDVTEMNSFELTPL